MATAISGFDASHLLGTGRPFSSPAVATVMGTSLERGRVPASNLFIESSIINPSCLLVDSEMLGFSGETVQVQKTFFERVG
jgi:hypothetical protein